MCVCAVQYWVHSCIMPRVPGKGSRFTVTLTMIKNLQYWKFIVSLTVLFLPVNALSLPGSGSWRIIYVSKGKVTKVNWRHWFLKTITWWERTSSYKPSFRRRAMWTTALDRRWPGSLLKTWYCISVFFILTSGVAVERLKGEVRWIIGRCWSKESKAVPKQLEIVEEWAHSNYRIY